ncbi:unnamed protein product, partial [Polarella glacialis]
AWSLAKLDLVDARVSHVLATSAARQLELMEPRFLCGQLAWAFAATGCDEPELFQAIADAATNKKSNNNNSNKSNNNDINNNNTINSSKKSNNNDINNNSNNNDINNYLASDLSNLAWAFAALGYQSPELFRALATRSQSVMHDFNPQDLSNLVWAYSTLGVHDSALFHSVGLEVPRKIREFGMQELSNLAWAFSVAGCASPAVFGAIEQELRERIRGDLESALARKALAKIGRAQEGAGRPVFQALGAALEATAPW